jgi:hypothetical protein
VYFDDVSLTSPSVSSGANELSNPAFTNLTVAWQGWGGGPLLTKTTAHSGTTSLLLPASSWLGQTVTWNETRARSLRQYLKLPACSAEQRIGRLNLEEAAARLGVSATVVRRLIERKILPAAQIVPCARTLAICGVAAHR